MRNQGFKSLLAWQKAYEMVIEVYGITKGFPKEENYGLTSQLQRAAVSVPANIAEGYERQHKKEYRQFLSIAKGSLGELETYLLLARDLCYISAEKYESLDSKRRETARILKGLINSLESSKVQGAVAK